MNPGTFLVAAGKVSYDKLSYNNDAQSYYTAWE
jgi:hypothetical protein